MDTSGSMTLYAVATLILIVAGIVDFTAAVVLNLANARSRASVPALRERAFTATMKVVSAVLIVIVGLNIIFGWGFTPEARLVIVTLALTILSFPAAYWLYLWRTGKLAE